MTSVYPKVSVYQYFDNWREISDCVQTPWRDKKSTYSLSFTDKREVSELKERLDTIFHTDFIGKFAENFDQAVSRYEQRRIATLHSSALLSLLCFHGVSGEKQLQLNICGSDCIFTKSFFEVKNQIENGNPSNIDVVLYGKCKEGNKPVLLYLESKFTEFLTPGNKYKIKKETYFDTYQCIFGKDMRIGEIQCHEYKHKYKDSDNEDWLKLTGSKCYCEGIKQMISHYMGLRDTLSNPNWIQSNELYEELKSVTEIYLGSIIYDFECTSKKGLDTPAADYKACYESIAVALNAVALNEKCINDKMHVLPKLLTYQEVFAGENIRILTNQIQEFYKLTDI